MNCPVCSTDLRAVDRQGVEIDYCPRCRGVWLDRGELDKLLARSAQYRDEEDDDDDDDRRKHYPPPQPGYGPPAHAGQHGHYPPPGEYRPKKKEGFWSRVFDFD